MNKNPETLVQSILFTLGEVAGEMIRSLPRPFETPYEHIHRLRSVDKKSYHDSVYNLRRQGLVAIVTKKGERFIKLTKKGELRILLAKTKVTQLEKWDKKWRLFIFDIPENSHLHRDFLRNLLKREGFIKLQASVFISPYQLNREGLLYLQKTGLIEFIRMMRVDEMDNDEALKKKFGLKSS